MSSNIDLPTFSSNFSVHVSLLERCTDCNYYNVGFCVNCSSNSRSMFFQSDIAESNLPGQYSYDAIINSAWDDLKSSVASWATVAITQPPYSAEAYTPPYVSLPSFSNNFGVRVNTIDICRNTDQKWNVSFLVSSSNINSSSNIDNSFVIGTAVDALCFRRGGSESNTIAAAWSNIEPRVSSWASNIIYTPITYVNKAYNFSTL